MKKILVLLIVLSGMFSNGYGQLSPQWDKLNWLVGKWVGEGSGQPGSGGGTFGFQYDLDSNILVRKSHSEYPAKDGRPATIHDDLMVVYPDPKSGSNKAVYFDNEGHIINYTITYTSFDIVFTSEKIEGVPVFRLIYTLLDPETCNVKFEMSQDGVNFSTYIEGKSKRIK